MFLFRSAFWLVVGFMVVAPHGTDFGSAAVSLKDQAVSAGLQAGQQIIVSQIAANPGLAFPALANPSVGATAIAGSEFPIMPRVRPAALG